MMVKLLLYAYCTGIYRPDGSPDTCRKRGVSGAGGGKLPDFHYQRVPPAPSRDARHLVQQVLALPSGPAGETQARPNDGTKIQADASKHRP